MFVLGVLSSCGSGGCEVRKAGLGRDRSLKSRLCAPPGMWFGDGGVVASPVGGCDSPAVWGARCQPGTTRQQVPVPLLWKSWREGRAQGQHALGRGLDLEGAAWAVLGGLLNPNLSSLKYMCFCLFCFN